MPANEVKYILTVLIVMILSTTFACVGGDQQVGVRYDIMHSDHVPELDRVEYSTTPPTSGNHWDTPQACGFYEDGLDDERITHNLEHGNIVVSYNLPAESQVAELRSTINGIEMADDWGVIRSYDKIPAGQVAVAAWGVLDVMEGVDGERIKTFFEAYADAFDSALTCKIP